MFEEREVFSMLLGWAVLAFALWHGPTLRRVPGWPVLFTAFALMALSWSASVIEGFVWEYGFNLVQHFSSAISAMVLAGWCFRAPSASGTAAEDLPT